MTKVAHRLARGHVTHVLGGFFAGVQKTLHCISKGYQRVVHKSQGDKNHDNQFYSIGEDNDLYDWEVAVETACFLDDLGDAIVNGMTVWLPIVNIEFDFGNPRRASICILLVPGITRAYPML